MNAPRSCLFLCGLTAAAPSSTASAHPSPTTTTAAIAAISSPAATVSAAPLCLRCCLLLFHNVDNLVGDAEVFDLWVRMAVRNGFACVASIHDDDDVCLPNRKSQEELTLFPRT